MGVKDEDGDPSTAEYRTRRGYCVVPAGGSGGTVRRSWKARSAEYEETVDKRGCAIVCLLQYIINISAKALEARLSFGEMLFGDAVLPNRDCLSLQETLRLLTSRFSYLTIWSS